MKKLLFVIILFQFKLVIGQNIVKFDSIVFYYNYSTYASKKNKSETETTKINRVNNSYYISNKKVDSSLINNLWIELNTNRDNFNNNYFLSKRLNIKKCKIKKHITFYSQILKSKNKNVTQKLKTQLIADIKNLKEFIEFVEFERPKKEAIYGSTDDRKKISISFFQNSKKSYFEFETFHSCGQPYYRGENFIKNKMVNLDVNQLVIDILSNASKFKKEFMYNNILDKYIDWYILKEFEKI